MSPNAKVKHLFKRLTRAAEDGATEIERGKTDEELLDDRTRALVIIGAAVCSESSTRTFKSLVDSARRAGATEDEILGVLLAVAPAAGESCLVSVAPRVSKALGYDVYRAFEQE